MCWFVYRLFDLPLKLQGYITSWEDLVVTDCSKKLNPSRNAGFFWAYFYHSSSLFQNLNGSFLADWIIFLFILLTFLSIKEGATTLHYFSISQKASPYALVISLHTCSVWETICDALPNSSYQDFWFKIPWVPPLKYFRKYFNENFVRTWHFGFELVWSSNCPPPTPINENLVRTWHFGFELEYPPLPKDSCGSWCVETNCCIPQAYHFIQVRPGSATNNINTSNNFYFSWKFCCFGEFLLWIMINYISLYIQCY